ncbi:MAG: 2-phosphosulfolactate phosphatase [Agriterribacter sp.]
MRYALYFDVNCDSSALAEGLYNEAKNDLFHFVKTKQASHYVRLSGYGLEKDIEYCLTRDVANVLPVYKDGRLVIR